MSDNLRLEKVNKPKPNNPNMTKKILNTVKKKKKEQQEEKSRNKYKCYWLKLAEKQKLTPSNPGSGRGWLLFRG